jgi:hypothetical protein
MKSRMQAVNVFVAVAVICGVAAVSVTELQAPESTVVIKRILSKGSHLPPSTTSFTGGIPPVCPTGACSSN